MEYAEFNPHKLNKEEPEPPRRQRNYRPRKSWKVAQRHHMGKYNAGLNYLTECSFMKLRQMVRTLYAQQGEYFYDFNQREDYSENNDNMHTIACQSLYLSLRCNPCFEYQVHYSLGQSPFEQEIATHIQQMFSKVAAKPFEREPDTAIYFEFLRSYYKDNPALFTYLNSENEER